ncbi:hypothetical protein [Kribbella sp. NPDC055071]
MSAGVEFFGGTALIIVIVIIAGRHLRRPGSPKGPTWGHITLASALFVVAGAVYFFPPHNVVLAALIMVLGAGFLTMGVATLGGGNFGYFGALAGGLAALPFLMTPTPLALSIVGTTIDCHVRDYRGHEVYEFTADCPGGKSYDFTKHGAHNFPGGNVPVIVDRHGILQAEFVGEENVTADTVGGILCLIGAAGIVVAALVHNRRLHGNVRHVVKPGFSSGP